MPTGEMTPVVAEQEEFNRVFFVTLKYAQVAGRNWRASANFCFGK